MCNCHNTLNLAHYTSFLKRFNHDFFQSDGEQEILKENEKLKQSYNYKDIINVFY